MDAATAPPQESENETVALAGGRDPSLVGKPLPETVTKLSPATPLLGEVLPLKLTE
jgi:hypothetical protein